MERPWSQSGATVTATNAAWNGSLAPGGSVEIGFNGSHTGAATPARRRSRSTASRAWSGGRPPARTVAHGTGPGSVAVGTSAARPGPVVRPRARLRGRPGGARRRSSPGRRRATTTVPSTSSSCSTSTDQPTRARPAGGVGLRRLVSTSDVTARPHPVGRGGEQAALHVDTVRPAVEGEARLVLARLGRHRRDRVARHVGGVRDEHVDPPAQARRAAGRAGRPAHARPRAGEVARPPTRRPPGPGRPRARRRPARAPRDDRVRRVPRRSTPRRRPAPARPREREAAATRTSSSVRRRGTNTPGPTRSRSPATSTQPSTVSRGSPPMRRATSSASTVDGAVGRRRGLRGAAGPVGASPAAPRRVRRRSAAAVTSSAASSSAKTQPAARSRATSADRAGPAASPAVVAGAPPRRGLAEVTPDARTSRDPAAGCGADGDAVRRRRSAGHGVQQPKVPRPWSDQPH